ncbi:MAG: outer membrane protein assembly factor BamB [Gammaproteobacteria bacterium]|nr:outer membrane protein assembly factor BamB [Gammaproteobacteria bacterium]
MKKIYALAACALLSSCTTISGIGEDNTPAPSALMNYQSQLTPTLLWSRSTNPAQTVSIFDLSNGMVFWKSPLKQALVAGPTIGNQSVYVGDNEGGVWALNLNSGKAEWHATLSDPIVSRPLVSNGKVFVRTLDGTVWALKNVDGSVAWTAAETIPTMVLSGGSKPVLMGNNIVVGSSNGKLTAYDAATGTVKWKSVIAEPQGPSDVEKMVDIVADPKLSGSAIYVVTYQGNLSAVNAQTGQVLWQTPVSSYSGLAVSTNAIFVTDAKGRVFAFDRKTGKQIWKQTYLEYRVLTAPTIMGNSIVIGDGEGVTHWLSQSTGETVARVNVSSSPIKSAPLVSGNNVYILSRNGLVSAYTA